MPPPIAKNTVHDLTDAEFAELDELLARTPEPLEPLDAVMLDGYLCGVSVQPVLLEPAAWLPHVFDLESTPLPDAADAAWQQRTTALILRPGRIKFNREVAIPHPRHYSIQTKPPFMELKAELTEQVRTEVLAAQALMA